MPTEARVNGDAIRLEQVLINLLHNALDAMAERPQRRLRILCERAGDAWQLSVADNGGGIPGEQLDQVFEPFFTTKPVGQGLGLGRRSPTASCATWAAPLKSAMTSRARCSP